MLRTSEDDAVSTYPSHIVAFSTLPRGSRPAFAFFIASLPRKLADMPPRIVLSAISIEIVHRVKIHTLSDVSCLRLVLPKGRIISATTARRIMAAARAETIPCVGTMDVDMDIRLSTAEPVPDYHVLTVWAKTRETASEWRRWADLTTLPHPASLPNSRAAHGETPGLVVHRTLRPWTSLATPLHRMLG